MKSGLAGVANIEELAKQFEQLHAIRLRRLLHPDLLELVSPRLEQCVWTTKDDGTIAREALPSDPTPASVLNFAANTSEFLDLIRRVTSRPEIRVFGGRVYRMEPDVDHFDSWHADLGTNIRDRLVGMSINLSRQDYRGGTFKLRDETSGEILWEQINTGLGDAIFFRISPALKHMVTPLSGTQSKTAFAGWFRSGDTEFYSMLKQTPHRYPSACRESR
ncbi:MAG: 2OG-Fe(II) oxygenase [Nitrospirota bacterium]